MALPTILVNSATGSDTQASGAGPSTALFGTTDASTDGAGTTVTLTAGTDLTNVATDGSHVIFVNDSTANAQNFGKITGKAGSGGATPTVTTATAFSASLSSKSWAIGGKRASIGSTTSFKLFNKNGSAADAKAGWTIKLETGHAETIAGSLNVYVIGDTTDGPVIIRGDDTGARPIITFNNNGGGFVVRQIHTEWDWIEFRNSNQIKTASIALSFDSGRFKASRLKLTHATDKFWRPLNSANGSGGQNGLFINCEIANAASHGITIGNEQKDDIIGCTIYSCGGDGINHAGTRFGMTIANCLIYGNTGDGIDLTRGTDTLPGCIITGNTIHGNGGSGILLSSTQCAEAIYNNQITGNGGYGISATSGAAGLARFVDYNNFGSGSTVNTSGPRSGVNAGAHDTTTDPGYVNATAGNFTVSTESLRAIGFPTAYGSVPNYVTPGALQVQSPTPAEIAEAVWEYPDRQLTA